MAVRTIDCSACGSTVPYGRLSCPTCGELLASVAGALRPLTSAAVVATPAPLDAPAILHDPMDLPAGTPWAADPDPEEAEDEPWDDAPAPPAAIDLDQRAAARWPESQSLGAVAATPTAVPGAYVPRAAPPTPEPEPPPVPVAARAWIGARAESASTSEAGAPVGGSAGSELQAFLDPSRRDETVGWVAVAGGTLAALGFLLPWSRTVIGSTGIDYFSTWGFAGPGHALVVVGILAVVALAVAGRRVPAWVRLGIPGLALGGLLLGLLWPYLFGPLGPLPGAYLSAVGAVVLMVAAAASLVLPRHRTSPPPSEWSHEPHAPRPG